MSQQQPKEIVEINQLFAQARSSMHATSGTANGLMIDNATAILSQFHQLMLSKQMRITQLEKENEDLKKKIPEKSKK